MSSDVSITMRGAEELARTMGDLGKRGAENAARAALRKTTNVLLKRVVEKSPVYSGVLQSSWKTKIVSGMVIKGYVFVDNKLRKPKNKQLRWLMKGVDWNDKRMQRMVKPKNPYFYAARVNETSKTSAGFFDDAVAEAAPVMDRELFAHLRTEIQKRRLAK
jgi:hypothetical protein